MTIKTIPKIYYIDAISSSNNLLNFREPNQPPALELTAQLLVGSRTVTDLMIEVQRSLNDAGANTYTVTFDRTTRLITISADDTFELLASSGNNVGVSPFSLLGFSSDRTGASSYVGDSQVATEYIPQFPLQSYKALADNLEGTESSINESADGSTVEVVTFGDRRFLEFNLINITSLPKGKDNPIRNSSTGLQDARDLMEFLVKKSPVEFMENASVPGTYSKVLLESTRSSKQGIGYELRELIGRGLNDHYETGILRFREIS